MKIEITYRTCKPHVMFLSVCPICGKKFIPYRKSKGVCSKSCKTIYNNRYRNELNKRIKNNPEIYYKYRKATIDQREKNRKEQIRKDLPAIKEALAKGDECLVDYMFNNYSKFTPHRLYRKEKK